MSPRLTPHRPEHEFDRILATASGPAIVIALATARIEAANSGGRSWLGAGAVPRAGHTDPESTERDTFPLDPAMPAITRLRELAGGMAPGTRCSVALTFWTSSGPRTAVCDAVFVTGAHQQALAVVEIGYADKPPATAQTSPKTEPKPTPGPTSDDAATLREIARRIREGQNLREGESMRARPPPEQSAEHDKALGDDQTSNPVAHGPDRADNLPEDGGGGQSVRLAKLAHELKTPLSAIVAAAEIMRDERLGPIENARYRSYASDIYDSARHALMVIGNMLGDATAAIELDQGSAMPAMVFTEIDLNAVADRCVSSMRPLADAAGLAMAADLAPGLPHIIADATAVRQIALNLLNNALKFTGPGGEIRLVTRHNAEGQVELEIRDSGRGMTREEIASAGLPSDHVTISRREGGGLGIGLPLVGALARANGAGLAIASEPSRGTTVTVAFAKDRVVPV